MIERTERLWGYYLVLYKDDCCTIKHLVLTPSKHTSHQSHELRNEYWTVLSGKGTILLNNVRYEVVEGFRIEIPALSHHIIINNGVEPLVIHEVQFGVFCNEEDIRRYTFPDCQNGGV